MFIFVSCVLIDTKIIFFIVNNGKEFSLYRQLFQKVDIIESRGGELVDSLFCFHSKLCLSYVVANCTCSIADDVV